jgi:preprotein translocase subunit SecE
MTSRILFRLFWPNNEQSLIKSLMVFEQSVIQSLKINNLNQWFKF